MQYIQKIAHFYIGDFDRDDFYNFWILCFALLILFGGVEIVLVEEFGECYSRAFAETIGRSEQSKHALNPEFSALSALVIFARFDTADNLQ